MSNTENSCCFTGYRPNKFPFEFEENNPKYRLFLSRVADFIKLAEKNGVTTFYTGMAMGFDIVAAEQVTLLKASNKNIRLIAVIPFSDQENFYPNDWKDRYYELLKDCDEVITLNDRYLKWAYDQRNRYMVDRSRYVITFFDGKKGGTMNTLNYADRHCRKIMNVYDENLFGDQMSLF